MENSSKKSQLFRPERRNRGQKIGFKKSFRVSEKCESYREPLSFPSSSSFYLSPTWPNSTPSPKTHFSRRAKKMSSPAPSVALPSLVGQPLDILKVRLQTSPPGTYTGMVDCATRIVTNEGPLAFYKGTLTPLLELVRVFRSSLA